MRMPAVGTAASAAAASSIVGQAAFARTQWNLETAYPGDNFHTRNTAIFDNDVADATDGALTITLRTGARLLKMPEINRGIQTG